MKSIQSWNNQKYSVAKKRPISVRVCLVGTRWRWGGLLVDTFNLIEISCAGNFG